MENYQLPLIFGVLASVNVLLGGILVLKLKNYFNNILGLAGGVMLGVVVFEILPEIFHLSIELQVPIFLGLFSLAFGILFFHLLSFFFPLHEHGHHEHESHAHHKHLNKGLGIYGAILMIGHSFIDGFGIGAGFLISNTVGLAIALAVLVHNFSDGVNTSSTLLHFNINKSRFRLLFGLSIFAPILGVVTSIFFQVSEVFIYYYLGFFAGSILYLAISDILPQAHADRKQKLPVLMTLLGVLLVVLITSLSSHIH
jgi:ZIP family zinc transporter